MFRLTSVILLLVFVAMPMLAHPAKGQDSLGQAPAAARAVTKQAVTQQSAASPSASSYPLDSFTEFSAVVVGSRVEPGEGASEGHIYRSGTLMRMEDPGRLGYYITDLTTGETYGISEMGCMHDSHPFIRALPFRIAAKADVTVTRAAAGKETVAGHSCRIENVTVSSPQFAAPMKMRFWEAEDLQGFPIKIEFLLPGGHDPIIRYKNVVLGPQDPTLFIHPKSCGELPQPQSEMSPDQKKPAAD
jgi:hypothetical protein